MKSFKVYFWKRLPKSMFKEIKNKYKDRTKDYMNVYVCENYEEMYNLCDKLENDKVERDYGARTYCFSRNWYDYETHEYLKTSPMCGYMAFNKEYFYMNAIAHESCHAVIGYFGRKLKEHQDIFVKTDKYGNIIDDKEENDINEELFCYMVGNIADQIVYNTEEKDEKNETR